MSSSSHESQPQFSQEQESARTPDPIAANTQITTIPGAAIEVGDETEDGLDVDEGFDSASAESSTTSISSSIRAHVWENGRRYNRFRQGQYVLPNDEGEQNREDMKHAMTLMLCDGLLHFAPIGDNPQNVIECVFCPMKNYRPATKGTVASERVLVFGL
jgi:hypothetical protein